MSIKRIVLLTLLAFSSIAVSSPQWGRWRVVELESPDQAPTGKFITAFEWSVARSSEFIWPFESMRPAPYDSVRMVVETMPSVLAVGEKEKRPKPLIASRHLRINGRLQNYVRLVRPAGNRQPEQQEFLVKLDRGRLRLALIVPQGRTLDPAHAFIRVKLYEATRTMAHPQRRTTSQYKTLVRGSAGQCDCDT